MNCTCFFRRFLHVIASLFRLSALLLSSLFKRNSRLIVFGAWFGNKYDDNPKALFEFVTTEHADIKAIWLTQNRNVYNLLKKKNLPVEMSNSIKGLWFAFRARYSVVCTSSKDIGNVAYYLTGNQITINLWHGVPLKKIVYDDEYNYSREPRKGFDGWYDRIEASTKRNTYYFSTSEAYKKIYQSCFNVDEKHVINLGQARNDYFFNSHDNFLKKRFSEFKRILLYMPTHRKEGKEEMNLAVILDLERLNEVLKVYDAVLLIKKHYFHSQEREIELGKYSNIIEITRETPNAQELLDAADILITDYSSCYIDYLLLNRPIIFYAYDLKDYLNTDRDMYFDYTKIAPGKICTTNEDLLYEINKTLLGYDDFIDIRSGAKDFYYETHNQKAISPDILDSILRL